MSTISASTTSTTAFKITTDTTGALVFQTGASPTTAMTLGSDQSVTFAGTPTYTGGTANGVAYLNASKVLTTGTALVFDGTNLGVGVTPSAWGAGNKAIEFGVVGNAAFALAANQSYLISNSYYNGSVFKYGGTGYATAYQQYQGTHAWLTAGSGTAGNTVAFTQAMTLDASGNLGVGNTTPSTSLSGSRGIAVNGASSGDVQLRLQNNNSGTGATDGILLSLASDNGGYLWNYENSYFAFGTNNTERVRIDSSGNLLVNRTSPNIAAARGLYVGGLISPASNYSPTSNIGGSIAFAGEQGSPVCGRVFFGDNTGWQWEWGPYGTAGWVRRFYFTDGGAAYNSSGTWGTISDARLKENIVDATPKLAELMQLRVRNFNFITEPDNKQLGFVAQEVEEVFPRVVDGTKPDDNGNTTKAVKTTVLIPILVKAIQEQQAMIEQLRADVAALKGTV